MKNINYVKWKMECAVSFVIPMKLLKHWIEKSKNAKRCPVILNFSSKDDMQRKLSMFKRKILS